MAIAKQLIAALAGCTISMASDALDLALDYKPFNGATGYQEIKVSGDVYYVAYHGTRASSIEEVNQGWSIRSAELCRRAGRDYFVELAYVFEPLTPDEIRQLFSMTAEARAIPAATPIYIPVPTGPRPAMINAPARLGAVRCVMSPGSLAEKERAVSVAQRLKEAQAAGVRLSQ